MTKFLVIFEKAGRNVSAYCPDLPGCVATGVDEAETERNIKGAIRMHLEGMREGGEPVPPPGATARYISL